MDPEKLNALDQISIERCIEIEQNTRGQNENPQWQKERQGRITASLFHQLIKRKQFTTKFISSIINKKPFTSQATSYGIANEKTAIQRYIEKSGHHVHECGLIINPSFPFLGASPDSKLCIDGETVIMEVKCPFSARHMGILEACSSLAGFCLGVVDDKPTLKHSHAYYTQVQGQLLVSGAAYCVFVVYTKHTCDGLFWESIYPDQNFIQNLLYNLTQIYFNHVKPALDNDIDSLHASSV